jgi:hypothetical protein
MSLAALKNLVGDLRCWVFDLRHGVRTRGDVELADLTVESPNFSFGAAYQPTHPKLIREVLSGLPIDYPRCTLVDYGSGKGRVLLVAAAYPFKRIVGVEFSRELHEVAQANIRRLRPRPRCPRIESVHTDALAFSLPLEPLVIFMFNPFGPSVLAPLMEGIRCSLLAHPRDAWLIYVSPFHAHLITAPFKLVQSRTWHNLYHAPSLFFS